MSPDEPPAAPEQHAPWTARGRAERKRPPNRLMRALLAASCVGGACLALSFVVHEGFVWGFYVSFVGLLVAFYASSHLDVLDELGLPREERWRAVVAGVILTAVFGFTFLVDQRFMIGAGLTGIVIALLYLRRRTVWATFVLGAIFGAIGAYYWHRDQPDSLNPAGGGGAILVYLSLAIGLFAIGLWDGSRSHALAAAYREHETRR